MTAEFFGLLLEYLLHTPEFMPRVEDAPHRSCYNVCLPSEAPSAEADAVCNGESSRCTSLHRCWECTPFFLRSTFTGPLQDRETLTGPLQDRETWRLPECATQTGHRQDYATHTGHIQNRP